MTGLLLNVCGVEHVLGAALYTNDGRCVEHRLPPPFEPGYVQSVSQDLITTLNEYRFLEAGATPTAYVKTTAGMIVIMLDENYYTVALATRGINPTLIRVAFSALRRQLSQLSQLSSVLSPQEVWVPSQSFESAQNVAAFSASPPAEAIPDADVISPVRNQAEVVPKQAIKLLIRVFTEYGGPASTLIIKDQVKAIGFNMDSLPKKHFRTLIENLSAKLVESDRPVFLKSVDKKLPM
ncbi:MAG: hypothetical protein KTR25_04620 [Myxococcales bacterium]|nr:hypothetical protein [Myxococcales bacterium]